MPSRLPAPPPSTPRPRTGLTAITSLPTAVIKLSPAFLQALDGIAPKKRRPARKVLALVMLAMVVVCAVVGVDPYARDLARAKGRAIAARVHLNRAPASAPAAEATTDANVAEPAAASSTTVTSAPITVPTIVIGEDSDTGPTSTAATATTSAKTVVAKTKRVQRRSPRAASRHSAAMVAAEIPADI